MRSREKKSYEDLIWPGYVDGLSTLLVSVMFVLMIFIVAESYLDDALNQRIKDAQGLRHQLCSLTESIEKEREENHHLNLSLGHLSHELMETKLRHRDLQEILEKMKTEKEEEAHGFSEKLEGSLETMESLKNLVYTLYHTLDQQAEKEKEPSSLASLDDYRQMTDQMKEKINLLLAKRIQNLEQYRSEFFGKLKESLGTHPDLKIVGDRFVVQSEILFPSGSSHLEPQGKKQLEKIVQTLKELTSKIPSSVPWILRIDGHTDRVPIRNSSFHSNWELSAARALSVVNFFIEHGIAPERLAAAGFGEFQPLEKSSKETSTSPQGPDPFRRDRRIELRLDQF